MSGPDVRTLPRAELETEVLRLRAQREAWTAFGRPNHRDHDRLESAERRQRAVFASAVDVGIVTTDHEGRVTDWNIGAERVFGWSADEMRGETVERIFTLEDRAKGQAATEMHVALAEGRAADERWHLRKDGDHFWASGEMMPLYDDGGAHLGYLKILRDRTAEHLAGKALEEAEARLRRAQEAGGVGLFTVDIPGDTLRPTPEFCRLYGLPERDSHPVGLFEALIIPEDAHLVSSPITRARGDALTDVEYRIRRADTGELRWIARRAEIERDEAGRPVRFSGASRDVTAEHAAQEALARSEARWRGLFERLSEGFIVGEVVRDTAGTILDWRYVDANAAWGDLVGIDPTTAIGQTIRELFPGIEDAWVHELADVVETNQAIAFTRQVGILGRWYEGRAFPLDQDRFGVIFLEVTDRVAALARRDALIALGERLRDGSDPQVVVMAASEAVGRALGAGRVGYGTVAADGETFTVEQDWTALGVPSLAGTYRMDDYGLYADELRRGLDVVIPDVREDPRTAGNMVVLESVAARTLINLPIIEHGRIVAVLYVNDDKPRAWATPDVAFIRQVAELLRQAVERRHAEERRQLLNHELSHRLKNTLAMVQAIAAQTLRNMTDPEAARDALAARLVALGKAHDILMTGEGERADMRAVIVEALTIHDDGRPDRFRIDGPPVVCSDKAALSLALMVHELATNAAKYGALSVETGHVEVTWTVVPSTAGEAEVRLTWHEQGGPPVASPTRKGFGTRLIERGLAGAVGGTITLRYAPDGVRCEVVAPLAGFTPDRDRQAQP